MKKALPYIMSLAIAVIMVFAAEISGEREIIFPEITALAAGAWLAPSMPWKTDGRRIFLLITANAFIGTAAVIYLPVHIFVKAALMLALSFGEMALFRTSFAPIISAAVLPVYLGTTSWLYPLSACAMAGIIVLGRLALERGGVREKNSFSPEKADREYAANRFFCFAAAALLMAYPLFSGRPFYAAPPLLVGFAELCDTKSRLRKTPLKPIFLTAFAALCGALLRYFLAVKLSLPLTLCAFAAAAAVLGAMCLMKLYFPPAGAIAILPMLIPEEALLSFAPQVTLGFAVMTTAAMLLFRGHFEDLSGSTGGSEGAS